ncbi:Phosphatidic acid phosphohydrolase 1 [Spathaspora sp. JA1]|nr:Phosphatidic acid phosphohydrolase 1 [Spathaspora sp. JA1]
MQYVGKVGDYVYNQWNSLNPATLSGAIDIIVIEQSDGTFHTSPWHIRFGKFQMLKPSQKKVDLYVNNKKTNLPMKLGDGGEAFFVFELDQDKRNLLSKSVLTSPVISPVSSRSSSIAGSPLSSPDDTSMVPDDLDLNMNMDEKIKLSNTSPIKATASSGLSSSPSIQSKIAIESAKKVTQKLNIPCKIDINGDMVIDIDGYKPTSAKNIENSEELFKKIFMQEIETGSGVTPELPFDGSWDNIITKDEDGNIRILNVPQLNNEEQDIDDEMSVQMSPSSSGTTATITDSDKVYFKTLRLTSEQLQSMGLQYGENSLKFKSSESNAQVTASLYLWKSTTPIVISDIDGTITKSDALGHVLNLIGRDWTHPGVAKLFQDIFANGYNIIYLTARSAGQSDSTRQYLKGINQDGIKLPPGPVILSPDRTFAALRREVVLKKPEVFKMACLSDIRNLFFNRINEDGEEQEEKDEDQTPFYAGFGNRITDAISYRSVHIPSHRIFTINPDGEVHMELLELAGYKSSYLHIRELVDHFFPPVKEYSSWNTFGWNDNQLNDYMKIHGNNTEESLPVDTPRSPGSPRSINEEYFRIDERYTDVNFWREPINLEQLSDEEDSESEIKVPTSPKIIPILNDEDEDDEEVSSKGKTLESGSFTSPLKSFMLRNKKESGHESDYTDEDVEEEDDYTDDDYEDDYDEEEDEDYEDDYEDEDEDEEDDEEDEDALSDVEKLHDQFEKTNLEQDNFENQPVGFVKASDI